MYMNAEQDDRETLLTIKSSNENYKRSEPFGIEGSNFYPEERPLQIPSFIAYQQTVYERSKCIRILCCCCHKKYKGNLISKINNKDLRAYYKMKSLASQLFDENNTQHKESLKFLYTMCINKETSGYFRSIEWKTVGFQQYETEYNEMITYEYFLFAIVCIRIVFMFKIYAHFMETEKDTDILLKTHRIQLMSVMQFRNLNRKIISDENYLFELLAKCVISVKNEYSRQYNKDKKEMNFLLIEPIIQLCFEIIYDELKY